jgi:hypothetical protein
MFAPCPLTPKADIECCSSMSALGQKRTSHAFRDLVECALDDDVSPCAGDYGLDLRLLRLGHGELVKGLLQVVEKGLPLGRSDHQMLVHFLHGTAGIRLRPTAGPADHFRDEILEACGGNTMMRHVMLGQARGHPSRLGLITVSTEVPLVFDCLDSTLLPDGNLSTNQQRQDAGTPRRARISGWANRIADAPE